MTHTSTDRPTSRAPRKGEPDPVVRRADRTRLPPLSRHPPDRRRRRVAGGPSAHRHTTAGVGRLATYHRRDSRARLPADPGALLPDPSGRCGRRRGRHRPVCRRPRRPGTRATRRTLRVRPRRHQLLPPQPSITRARRTPEAGRDARNRSRRGGETAPLHNRRHPPRRTPSNRPRKRQRSRAIIMIAGISSTDLEQTQERPKGSAWWGRTEAPHRAAVAAYPRLGCLPLPSLLPVRMNPSSELLEARPRRLPNFYRMPLSVGDQALRGRRQRRKLLHAARSCRRFVRTNRPATSRPPPETDGPGADLAAPPVDVAERIITPVTALPGQYAGEPCARIRLLRCEGRAWTGT